MKLVLVCLLLVGHTALAGSRRALVVGINRYAGPSGAREWSDLEGSVDDARAFADLLEGRYGFRADEVRLLVDNEASRAGILAGLDWLLDGAAPGSLCIFYYAGHGSQIVNSKSSEADKLDETLVPADASRGAADIRDKELARRFDRAARAGADVTVVLDSCHSGSATRGLGSGRARMLAPGPGDAADAEAAPDPTLDGAVVLAAAEDRELAREVIEDGKAHGAFTLALIQALSTLPVDESLERVFRKTRAILQRDGRGQEPDLRGPDARKKRSLAGATSTSARPTVAVASVSGKTVELQGGRADDLAKGCELVHAGARIRVLEVTGLSSARARLLAGTVAPGDLFVVDRWVAPDRPNLTVFLPAPMKEPQKLAAAQARLAARATVTDAPEEATHVIAWDGKLWRLEGQGRSVVLGKELDVERAVAAAPASSVFFLQIPPSPELMRKLDLGSKSRNPVVAVGGTGQYVLAGRLTDGHVSYAWVQRGRVESILPLRGDWSDDPARLTEQALQLGRIRGWLLLETPREDFFPYHLALRDAKGLRTDGTLVDGDIYRFVLRADGELPAVVLPRYVYVFALDPYGKGRVAYPAGGGGGGENRLPALSADGPPREIPLPVSLQVGAPFGVDSYVVLATDEPLPDPDVFDMEGVRTRNGAQTPLMRLLAGVSAHTRGPAEPVPATWSLDRISFKSEVRH